MARCAPASFSVLTFTGNATATPDTFHIKGETTFDVADYDTLKADMGKCLDGVKAAIPVLTQTVAVSLGHTPQTVAAQ